MLQKLRCRFLLKFVESVTETLLVGKNIVLLQIRYGARLMFTHFHPTRNNYTRCGLKSLLPHTYSCTLSGAENRRHDAVCSKDGGQR